jgi:HAD superfamily hydrolase (TIGR01509 family)
VDTEPYWIAAEHDIVEEHGGTWSEELSHQLVGKDLLVAATFIRDNSAVEWSPEQIVDEMLGRVIVKVAEHMPWRPGARELLTALKAEGIPSALVTMSWRSLADAVLAALPDSTFDVVVTGDEVSHGKPHPEPYRAAARLLGVSPQDCVAIEDSPTGVRSAVAAGVPTLAVPHVVTVPEMAGAVHLDSLAGLTPSRLAELAQQARATASP